MRLIVSLLLWRIVFISANPILVSERPVLLDSIKELTDADYEGHLANLKKKLPSEKFTVIIQKPFVVIGDAAPSKVKSLAEYTIKWAVDMLKQDYFEKDPEDIIDIWLFKDKESYEKYTKEIFGIEPSSPFGFYLETEKALIMNINTGGGTLVHEIVHPFIRVNFSECPTWFNEGLASLYEQCGEKNEHIYGDTNWRLKGLQQAIKTGKVPSFETLTSMDANTFYNEDKGVNYSQSRYLLYYLQEKGVLVKFYHEFYKQRKKDPTGYVTLKKVLGISDMGAFKKTWENFVLKLIFP